jgi:hypothetical protein
MPFSAKRSRIDQFDPSMVIEGQLTLPAECFVKVFESFSTSTIIGLSLEYL